jgi:hypothetical protein
MPAGAMQEPAQTGSMEMPAGFMGAGAFASGESVMPEPSSLSARAVMPEPGAAAASASAGEMPSGEMNAPPPASAAAAPDDDPGDQTLEIPGAWRLILRRKR